MLRRGSVSLSAPALLVLLALAAAPPALADDMLDPRNIMNAVNANYQRLIKQTREVNVEQNVTMRSLQQQDITIEEEDIIYLQGDKARVETIDSRIVVPRNARSTVNPNDPRYDQRRRVWVHDGETTKILFEGGTVPNANGTGGTQRVEGFIIRHDQMPESLPRKFRAPLVQNEFDEVFLNAPFYAYASIYKGRPVYVLQSMGSIVANDKSLIQNAQFWVDSELLLLVHQELEIRGSLPAEQQKEPAYLVLEQDMATTVGVTIDPKKFELELPLNAKDLTELVVTGANASNRARQTQTAAPKK